MTKEYAEDLAREVIEEEDEFITRCHYCDEPMYEWDDCYRLPDGTICCEQCCESSVVKRGDR